jgi:four helix bundle protein
MFSYAQCSIDRPRQVALRTGMIAGMRNFRNIKAWHLADDLAVAVYDRTREFPREELYGLSSQLRRAATSVAANIVEGSARGGQREYLQFLHIARGSLCETQYLVHLSRRVGYLSSDDRSRLDAQAREVFACLSGLIDAVVAELP